MKFTRRILNGGRSDRRLWIRRSMRRPTSSSASPPSPIRRSARRTLREPGSGWEIDLMNAVCAKMNEKCELVEVAWDGIIPALDLEADRRDLVFDVDHRRAQEDDRFHRHVLQHADGHHRYQERRQGYHAGSSRRQDDRRSGFDHSQRYVDKYFGAGSTIKTYQTQDEANQDLAAGRLDYIQADGQALDAFLKTEQGAACCELKGEVPDDKEILGEGVGGGIRKEDTALKEKLNAAIGALAKADSSTRSPPNIPNLSAR